MSAAGKKVACGLVPFPHLHEAMRTLAFVLSFGRGKPPTPFDKDRAAAADAIRVALEHPMNAESAQALLTQRDALDVRIAELTAEVAKKPSFKLEGHDVVWLSTYSHVIRQRDALEARHAETERQACLQAEALGNRIAALEAREKVLRDALLDAEAYFDNHADVVDGDYGEPAPNKAMRMLMVIRAALATGATK